MIVLIDAGSCFLYMHDLWALKTDKPLRKGRPETGTVNLGSYLTYSDAKLDFI